MRDNVPHAKVSKTEMKVVKPFLLIRESVEVLPLIEVTPLLHYQCVINLEHKIHLIF